MQGYVVFDKSKRMGAVKEALGGIDRIHLEPSRGTAEENFNYCTKEGEWWICSANEGGFDADGNRIWHLNYMWTDMSIPGIFEADIMSSVAR